MSKTTETKKPRKGVKVTTKLKAGALNVRTGPATGVIFGDCPPGH